MNATMTPRGPSRDAGRPAPLDLVPYDSGMEPVKRRPSSALTLPEAPASTIWPVVLCLAGTAATGCDLLEWPGASRDRGRFIIRRYRDHVVTERVTTDSLRDAEALFYHFSTPLPADTDPKPGD